MEEVVSGDFHPSSSTWFSLAKAYIRRSTNFRSGISPTREEPSYQASLMAGDLTSGPSDAPCLMESSTAHGELLLRTTASLTRAATLIWFSSSTLNLNPNPQTPVPLSPEMPELPQNPSSSRYGRSFQVSLLPDKVKLGFQLVGLLKSGPIRFLKPKSKNCGPIQILQKPRSAPNSSLSICNQSLCRLSELIDQGHQLEHNSPILLWLYKKSVRSLPIDSHRTICHETESLKENGSMFPILRSRWCDDCHRSFLNNLSTTHLDTEFKQLLTSNKCKAPIIRVSQETFKNLKKDLDLLPHVLLRIQSDYRTVVLFFLANERPHLAILVPARISAMESYSTSPSLLTVTTVSSNASFVDEPLINRVITCANVLTSYCLQALMEPLSISFIYPFVALENAFISFVLNFYLFVSLVSLNLVFI